MFRATATDGMCHWSRLTPQYLSLVQGEATERVSQQRQHPCRNATLLLVVSLLVNALLMSAVMTEEMERSAEQVVKTSQLHAFPSAPVAAFSHAVAHPPAGAPSASATSTKSGKYSLPAPVVETKLGDSAPAVQHKKRSAIQTHLALRQAHHEPLKPGQFNIEEFWLALLKRREEMEAGKKPTTALRKIFDAGRLDASGPSVVVRHVHDGLKGVDSSNPNDQPALVVDKQGAFFDPKLKVLVDAQLLGTRTASEEQEAVVLAAEEKAAETFLPQLATLTTEDIKGHLITVKENEAQQLANGIFTWGHENPDTGDMRLDCTDTLANAGSNGGELNRLWGGNAKVDPCGPLDQCSDKCAYEPCNIGKTYKVSGNPSTLVRTLTLNHDPNAER